MNQSPDVRRREIATRDLLFRALSMWRIILIVALLGAAAFLFMKMKKSAPQSNAGENGESYEKALEDYRTERSSLEELITRSKELIGEKRSYLASSILMQIDPAKVGKAAASLVVTVSEADRKEQSATPEQIVDALASFAAFGLDLEAISEELGTDSSYIAELISTNPSVISTSTYAAYSDATGRTSDVPRGTLTVTVVHPEAEMAEKILGVVLPQIEKRSDELASSLTPHTLTVVSKDSGYFTDTSIGSRSENLLQELYMLSTNEERLESQLTSLKRPSQTSGKEAKLPVKTLVLYAALGLIGGGLLALLIIVILLTFSGRVLTAAELNGLYSLNKLAVIPDEKEKRNPIDRLISRLDSDNKNGTDPAIRYRLAAEALASPGSEKKSYLLISSLPQNQLEVCKSSLEAALSKTDSVPILEIAPNLTEDPGSMKKLGTTDGVILVEKIGVSRYDSISNLLAAVQAKSVPIVGSILL